jgi:AcrR family transcriptional regulator
MSCNADAELDPRVRRTRALLQEALRSLLREKRFANISVAEIAERATVNRNTFYAHYQDKHTLLERVLREDLSRQLCDRFPEKAPLTRANFAAAAAIVIRFLGGLEAACPRTARDAESLIHPAIQEEIRQLIDAWLPAEGPDSPVRPGSRDTAVTAISWSLFGCAHRWSRGKRDRPAEELAQELATMLLPVHARLAVLRAEAG